MQTQIILAIIGALVMIVVGTSLARAFGVVGAAGLVRYRAKIDDPKDAGVMLTTLAVGLACGIGVYGLAVFATVFLMGVLWMIESFEPSARKEFILEIKSKKAIKLQPTIEALLRRRRVKYELRESTPEELSYFVQLPMELKTDSISAEIIALDPDPGTGVEWKTEQRRRRPEERMELIIQPKDGLTPLVSAIKKATKQIDITIFRFDLKELQRALESAVTRGVKVHALIATHRAAGRSGCASSSSSCSTPASPCRAPTTTCCATTTRCCSSIARRCTRWGSTTRGSTSRRAAPWPWRPRTRRSSLRPSSCSRPTRRGSRTRRITTTFS